MSKTLRNESLSTRTHTLIKTPLGKNMSFLLFNRNVMITFVTVFIMGIVSAFVSWFLPIYLSSYGTLTLVAFVYTIANIVSIPPILVGGLMSDVLGRKPLILLSTLLYTISFSLLLFQSQITIATAAILMLLASALIFSPLTALLGESVEKDRIAIVFSWKRLIATLAASIGSILLGYLVTFGMKEIILICLGASLIAFTARLFLIETSPKRVRASILTETVKILKNVGMIFKMKQHIRMIAFAVAIVSLGSGIFEIYFPIYLNKGLELSSQSIGVTYAISHVVPMAFFTIAGHIVERLGWLRSLVLALFTESILISALAIIPWATVSFMSPFIIVVSLYTLLTLASALDQVSGDKMLMNITTPEIRGVVIASLASITLLSKVFSPSIGALIAMRMSYSASLVVTALLYFAGSIAILGVKQIVNTR